MLAAMALFLVAEWRGWRAGKWIGKPLASAAFVGVAWLGGASATPYGRWVLAALVLSWLGDVLLIPASTFLLGLGSFLVGHLAFAAAFVARGVAPLGVAVAALLCLLPAVPISRWLLPHVEAKMRGPVIAYMIAISAMVALAVGTIVAQPQPLVLAAALGFYFSDLSVARDRFVAKGFVNRLWGVPLYYAAQLAFAWTVRS